jgi:hypothetical protein
MTLFNCLGYVASNRRMILNGKLEKAWNEAVTDHFKALQQHFAGNLTQF